MILALLCEVRRRDADSVSAVAVGMKGPLSPKAVWSWVETSVGGESGVSRCREPGG